MNCLKITKSASSFNSFPFSVGVQFESQMPIPSYPSHLHMSLFLSKTNNRTPEVRQEKASRRVGGKHAWIYCPGTTYPPPAANSPAIAGWSSFFCSFRKGLHTVAGAISMESGRHGGIALKRRQINTWKNGFLGCSNPVEKRVLVSYTLSTPLCNCISGKKVLGKAKIFQKVTFLRL